MFASLQFKNWQIIFINFTSICLTWEARWEGREAGELSQGRAGWGREPSRYRGEKGAYDLMVGLGQSGSEPLLTLLHIWKYLGLKVPTYLRYWTVCNVVELVQYWPAPATEDVNIIVPIGHSRVTAASEVPCRKWFKIYMVSQNSKPESSAFPQPGDGADRERTGSAES